MSKNHSEKHSHRLTILLVFIFLFAAALMAGGVYLVFFKNRDAFERQSEEEDLGDEYVEDLLLKIRDPEAYAEKEALLKQEKEEREQASAKAQEEGADVSDGSKAETDLFETSGLENASDKKSETEGPSAETSPAEDGGEAVLESSGAKEAETESVNFPDEEKILQEGKKLLEIFSKLDFNMEKFLTASSIDDAARSFFTKMETGFAEIPAFADSFMKKLFSNITGKEENQEISERFWLALEKRMKETHEKEEETGAASDYADTSYYERDGVVYTPDYAKGYLDCRLEVPSAGIRRGVYSGTWEDLAYDLDIWMVTAARPDYVLGETHYCIYGHNHTVQNLSFNNLQKVQVGEYFYLTAESGYYTYLITDVFAISREDATTQYVDNFSLGSDKCYIITCGRDDGTRNFRYLDLIVEGTLERHLTLEEYADLLEGK